MDPNTKLLIDEMKKLGDHFTAVESRVDGLESALGDRFKAVEASSSKFLAWQPGMDTAMADLTAKFGAVDDIKLQIGVRNKQLD